MSSEMEALSLQPPDSEKTGGQRKKPEAKMRRVVLEIPERLYREIVLTCYETDRKKTVENLLLEVIVARFRR